MEIKVFGPGCSKCAELEKRVRELVLSIGKNADIRKVTDFREMMTAGIMSTPALSIDGNLKCTGRVPSKEEMTVWINEALAASDEATCSGTKG